MISLTVIEQIAKIISTGIIKVPNLFFNTIPENSNWILQENGMTSLLKQESLLNQGNFSTVSFDFKFQRKFNFYMVNLLVPSFILNILILACFLLPADTADRPLMACVILLSVFVLQGQMMNNLPKTPKPVLLSYYLLGMLVLAMLCVTYTCLMLCFADRLPDKAHKSVNMSSFGAKNLKLFHVVDAGVFVGASVIFISVMIGMMLYMDMA